jgi:hypothetical protein
MSNEPTMKLVTNLDRAAIEANLREVGSEAAAAGLTDLAKMFKGIEGLPAAQIEQRVNNATQWLADKPQHVKLIALLELVGMNLKNLK